MKWRSHIKILRAVLENTDIKLDNEIIRGLFKGITEPDVRPDYDIERKRIVRQHDKLVAKLVKYYLELAVHLYHRGQLEESGRALGRAIHYAQDLVLKRRKFILVDVHEELEKKIDNLCKNLDKNIVLTCIEKRPKRSNKAENILCSAISITYKILNMFTQNINRSKMVRRCIIGLAILLASCLASYTDILLMHSLPMFMTSILIVTGSIAYIFYAFRLYIMKPRCRRFRTVM